MKHKYKITFYMPNNKKYKAEMKFNDYCSEEDVMINFVHLRFLDTNKGYVNPAKFTVVEKIEYFGQE